MLGEDSCPRSRTEQAKIYRVDRHTITSPWLITAQVNRAMRRLITPVLNVPVVSHRQSMKPLFTCKSRVLDCFLIGKTEG
jgi:hypothetical protein